jgi:pyruvate/2-oxoglutarate dehydrogenase complex dihydrolipoamide dehydrogenase (E3) component
MSYTYDVLVIGGGAAGLTAAGIGATLGAKTLMIERHRFGGDCTWTGCVPSKTLLKSAKIAHHIRTASAFGLVDQPITFDFAKMMTRLRHIREEVYEDADAPPRFEELGADVRYGDVRFVDPHTVEVTHNGTTDRVSGRFIIVAAGASAFVPPIEGIREVPYRTNESIFEISELPPRLAVIGGGPIGTEMAQAFQRLGSQVTVFQSGDRILPKDDPELTTLLKGVLEQDGIDYRMNAAVKRVSQHGTTTLVEYEMHGQRQTLETDTLLVATGRAPNLNGLNLEAAGVAYTNRGITVDERCRTNVRHIYAIGDISGRYQFTHMSEHMAKVAMTNALLKFPMKIDRKHVPWVTYTDPELAHVGATEDELKKSGTKYEHYRFPYSKIDRAITEGETVGWIKIFGTKGGRILGVSILGTGAGELICEYAVAMRNGLTLRQISDTIHPYPTWGLGARRAADQWYVRQSSPFLTRLLQKLFGYRGPVNVFPKDRIV